MLFGNVPMAKLRSFIIVRAEMDPESNLFQSLFIELEIRRRVVGRIPSEDNEQLDAAGIDVPDELTELFDLRLFRGRERLSVYNRLPDVAKSRVHGVSQCVHHG